MAELVEDVVDYLDAQGVGTKGTDLFMGQMPSIPLNVITVVPSGGVSIPGDPISREGFQILIRNSNTQQLLIKSRSVYDTLNNKWAVLANFKCRILADAHPTGVFLDEANRELVSVNFSTDIAP